MNLRFILIEKTPFPGRWVAVPRYLLQEAEFNQFKGDGYYHKRAQKIGAVLAYGLMDANRLLEYLEAKKRNAQYMLMGVDTPAIESTPGE